MRIILAFQNGLESVLSCSVLWMRLCRIGGVCFLLNVGALVFCGQKKISHSGWLQQETFVLSQSWRPGVHDQGAGGVELLWGICGLEVAPLFLPPHLVIPLHMNVLRVSPFVLISPSHKDTSQLAWGSP